MIIKLTKVEFSWSTDEPIKSPIFINKYQIKYFNSWTYNEETYTELQIGDRLNLTVTEKPEVILSLIKET